MTTVRIPLVGSPTNRSNNLEKDQRFVNCFPEAVANPLAQGQKVYLVKRDGLNPVAFPANAIGEGRGLYSFNDRLYSVVGDKLYSSRFLDATWAASGTTTITVTSDTHGISNGSVVFVQFGSSTLTDGNFTVSNSATNTFDITYGSVVSSSTGTGVVETRTSILTLTTSTGAVSFTEFTGGNHYMVLLDGLKGYFVSTLNVATEITDTEFPTPHIPCPVFMDSYLFVQKTTGEIFNCDVGEIDKWAATSFISSESYPDGPVWLARQNNLVVALNQFSVEFFYDAANPTPGSPLARNLQALLQFGCASGLSVAQEEGLLIFVAQSATGEKFVTAIEGTKDNTISTEAINRIINAEGVNVTDSWGYITRQKGHPFYVLNLPFQGRTLVFDLVTKYWHEWEWDDGTLDTMFPMVDTTEHMDYGVYLHQANGKLYRASATNYKDDNLMALLIQTSRFDGDSAKVKFLDRIEVLGDWQDSTANMSIYWSDDDYKTWTTARTVDLSKRAYLYRCGSFRQRAWRMYFDANLPFRVSAIELEVRGGVH